MIEIVRHHRKTRWQRIKEDLAERFLKFETFNGAFVYIPWGWGFFYYGFPWQIFNETDLETVFYVINKPQFGYNYALMSTGIVLMIWGLRKTFVNRIKQAARTQEQVEKRMDAGVS